jgi:guanylate kinase
MAGKAILFSAPSGSGKTSLVRALLEKNNQLAFSVSATTRPKRSHEVDGRDYFFLSEQDFRSRISAGHFIEWEEVYSGTLYGTLKPEVEKHWALGRDVIFDIDVQGGLRLKKYFGENALAIFVAVPSLEELRNRLAKRGTESEESFRKRIDKAEHEATFSKYFDRIIVNDDFERALNEAQQLYQSFAT